MGDYIAPRSIVEELWDQGAGAITAYDPLADGLLMPYQKAWIADPSRLKVCEKGRRTGITWAEAYDSVFTAAAEKEDGGDDVWYIGDTKEKGREFVKTCAAFAEKIAKELLNVEEFLFEDVETDGTSKQITAWRIKFASDHRISALSSRPSNIRGLQGVVVVDEAGFHPNVADVIDACNALFLWGGEIHVISTHNGNANPFNDLLKEVRAGIRPGTVHTFPFDLAVAQGLYERAWATRLRYKGYNLSPEDKSRWYNEARKSYGSRTEAMREELDAIPREGEGTMLPLALIEAAQRQQYTVCRWVPPDTVGGLPFVDWSEDRRREHMEEWISEHVLPILKTLPHNVPYALGGDFAMRQDRAAYAVGYTDQQLHRHVPFIVELRECPYDQQKQLLFFIGTWLRENRLLQGGVLDANGNGMVLAQEARQKFGADRIVELMPSDAWLREVTPKFSACFTDKTMHLPADLDVRSDLHQFRVVGGVGKIPRDVRVHGVDGGRRHGDTAVALLNFYAATLTEAEAYGYRPVRPTSHSSDRRAREDGQSRRVRVTGGFAAKKGML
jgi:phage FluMu gp28-like protein